MRILLIGVHGYVGARLAHDLTADGHVVIGCDHAPAQVASTCVEVYSQPYQMLPDRAFDGIEVVLWFAGHSSVRQAEAQRWEGLKNNVSDLASLFTRLAERRIPAIYASSASVLSSSQDHYSLVANEMRSNAYDSGKLAFDLIVPYLGGNFIGLRMATVSGWSPVMRWDLIFNAMNRSAQQEHCVRVTNASNFRSLLFLDDLVAYIRYQLARISKGESEKGALQMALGSWSGSIGTLAAEIAEVWGAPLEFGPDSGTYSFVVSDRDLNHAFSSHNAFYRSIKDRCRHFADQNKWMLP